MQRTPQSAAHDRSRKLGPFRLMPDITPLNGLTYFVSAMLAIPMLAALSFLQPIMMRIVGVERAIQGTLSGDLVFFQECIVLVATPFIGALTDKLGRKPLLLMGMSMLGTTYALYPFADSVAMMYAYRVFFGMGVAMVATTITIVSADYVHDRSRGTWVATASLTQGIGIFAVTQVLRRVPASLAAGGASEAEIAQILFWGCMAICIGVLVLMAVGLSPRKPAHIDERESLLSRVRSGVDAARHSPRVALAYATAFAARGDLLVVSTFGFLWTQQAAEDLGLGAAEGLARGGMVVGIVQGCALLWAPFMGKILNHVDRVTGVIVAFSLSAVGYTAFGLIDDPFSSRVIPAAVLLGVGEISTMISANALIGQSAPASIRGSVLGCYALCGAAGLLFASAVGGRLFDLWMAGGPFVQMGVVNAIVLIAAILVRVRTGPVSQQAE
ncbi:MAG: MFS transporter [Gammaproteobacteria bacterium]|nr:MFS transporter [Gammaproteobacteria bacterium]